ncbi:hypothetical protein [Nibricoccus sp. IMCC34717]|uniref:hypothetical protein n=1 Tax=Nibricoccus sp. IMCC34717 TaxID=3034021 RepID=UPI00384FD9A9
MKRLLSLVALHVGFLIFGFVLFVVLFRTPLAASQTVFFYRGCRLVVWAAVFQGVIALGAWAWWRRAGGDLRDIIGNTAVAACLNLVFFTHLPVTADRSVSVFLLGYLTQHSERRVTEAELERALVEKYIRADHAIARRLKEQLETGTVTVTPEGVQITPKGQAIIRQYERMTRIFELDPRLVRPGE